jgi:hypothetical protein
MHFRNIPIWNKEKHFDGAVFTQNAVYSKSFTVSSLLSLLTVPVA